MRARRLDDRHNGEVWFVLDGIPPGSALERGAQEMEFHQVDGGWGRRFPAQSLLLDEGWAGFSRLGSSMLERHVAGGGTQWEAALETAIKRAESAGVSLFVVGGAAAAIHGADIAPGDVDLVVSDRDAAVLGEALVDVLVEPVAPTDGWISRWFGRAFVGDCRVEWAGGVEPFVDQPEPPDFGPIALARSVEVAWQGHAVRVPPLNLLRAVNVRRGRTDRVAAIDSISVR